jgi:membrane protein implicated in regulation of membrane protease activity
MRDGNVFSLLAALVLTVLLDPLLLWLLVTFWPVRFVVSAWFTVTVYYSVLAAVLTIWFVYYLLRPVGEEPAGPQARKEKEEK